eukprot:gnl/TRDRNA2_/TRDRNA2_161325_c0_seq1.p1 gnl/TRDRNA2_/TRDRNA2_161325_c0~~gnl/TRDRNA2_/TRDRNA2_161325_c0_seq1.p1  ORF type:complete len:204 (-),score=44.40 gnl/TRDRNA2_/TRDRNA2_161325_c0_seq1:78-689(-)
MPYALTERGQVRRICELNEAEFKEHGFACAAFGGKDRVEELREFLRCLKEHGAQLFICTKGLVGAVRKCLDDLSLLDFFTDVYGNAGDVYGGTPYDQERVADLLTPEMRKFIGASKKPHWTSKAELIDELMSEKGFTWWQAVLVEDDPLEIKKAAQVCRTLSVTEAAGITPEQCAHLLSMTKFCHTLASRQVGKKDGKRRRLN